MRTFAWAVVAACLLAGAPARGVAAATRSDVSVRRRPDVATHFEANRGQTAPQVDFVARCCGYVAFLTPGGATFKTAAAAFRVRFVGATAASHARGLESAPGRSNYLVGSDPSKWTTDVPQFERVAYDGTLPGADVVWRGDGRAVAYDVSLAPGVDPATARLRFEGADSVALDDRGDVVLTIAGGTATMSAPRAWQDLAAGRRDVAAAFVVGADGEVGFRVGAHDAKRPLVIDPSFTVSTYLGGSTIDSAAAVATDSAGGIYVTGTTASAAFPVTAGAFQPGHGTLVSSADDAFVTKYGPGGASFVYSTFLGGNGADAGRGIAVDGSGNAYVTGATSSTDFPTTTSPYRSSGAGFLTELNADGKSLAWSTYLAGGADRVRLDSSSGVYVLGGASDAGHVLKFDSSGMTLVYDADATTGSTGPAFIDMAVTPDGLVWAVGQNPTSGQATPGAFQTIYGGGAADGWIVKLGATGVPTYATYLGGSGADSVGAVAVGADGDVYLAGSTTSTDFPTASAWQSTNAGAQSVWVAMMDPQAQSLKWSTYLGGSSSVAANALAVDACGDVAVVGTCQGGGFPTFESAQGSSGGGQDAVLAEFAPNGALVQSSFVGGAGVEEGFSAAFDADGRPFIVGRTTSSGFPTTAQAHQTALAGSQDAFLTGFPSNGGTFADDGPLTFPPTTVGVPYAQALTIDGGAQPLAWSAYLGALPDGLSLSSDGTLFGVAAGAGGDVSFTARVLDSTNACAVRTFVVPVNAVPSVTTTSVPAWTVGRPFSAPLAATGGTLPFSWTEKTGTLPPGVVIDSTGRLSADLLTDVGSYSFVVQALDHLGVEADRALTMQVNPAPRITTSALADAIEKKPASVAFVVADGTPPFTWSVTSGTIPVSAALDPARGYLSGTAFDAGDYAFAVRVTDAAGAVAERAYAMRVTHELALTTTLLPWGARNRPYSFAALATGGSPPYAWSVPNGLLVPGVALGAADGSFVGAPQRAGIYDFTCRCADAAHASDERQLGLFVADEVGLSGAKADASSVIDFLAENGVSALRYVELLEGAELTVAVAGQGKGEFPVAVTFYDPSQNQIVLGDSATTKSGQFLLKKFRVPATGRYFVRVAPLGLFQGSVSLRIAAPPQTKWSGVVTLDASGAPVVATFSAPAGATFSFHVAPAGKSAARPTIAGATDSSGAELLVPGQLRETKTGATLSAKTPLAGGDVEATIAPRDGLAGDVVWTATLKTPRKYAFSLPDVAVDGAGK